MNTGFFDMEDARNVLKEASLKAAQDYCFNKIFEFSSAHPATKPINLQKAEKMILRAKSKNDLAESVSNFVLAHPSEGLKVI